MEATYNLGLTKIEDVAAGGGHHRWLPVVDWSGVTGKIKFRKVQEGDYLDEWLSIKPTVVEFPQDRYRFDRLVELGEEYFSGAMGEEFRMVEGVFPHGSLSKIYMTVLLKKSGERFEAVYSIPSLG